ncbi:LacI family DNA-binding transcriptional regulator [Geminisphaera colitermitum]|uniref:LacI family DNA-binding transcriptional regulator n=1 Tax=Geminisphaera colitermitum TaxID=1148786 RepID=UPI000158D1B1|nr:LacI family DNA-binding transcriptional regulator [Geminisphaera colitermitum]
MASDKSFTRISLKTVAEAAGVSRMTVSLALRNHPALAAGTRARVCKIAQKLGYRPDPEIGRVMSEIRSRRCIHKPSTIAYVTAHERHDEWKRSPTYFAYYEGAARRAEACGYHLEAFWAREKGMTPRRLSEVIHNRGINGVIVSPFPYRRPPFEGFCWDYFSAVALGYSLEQPELHRACNHQFRSMQLLVSELYRRGYRRIGFAMEEDMDNRVCHNWRGGFMSDAASLPGWPVVPFLLHADWTRERFARWLEAEKPDVVVTTGAGVEDWLAELGLRAPRDIGLAVVDLAPLLAERRITGIHQNTPQVGAAGVDLLISLMNSNERGVPETPRILMVEGKFVQGETTRC